VTLDGEKASKLKTTVKDSAGLFNAIEEFKDGFDLKGICIANATDQNLYFLQDNYSIKFEEGPLMPGKENGCQAFAINKRNA
jgi:hypothetical protein